MAAALGTEHNGFDSDWAWGRIHELWPKEITPSQISQQECIRNEWKTYMTVNVLFRIFTSRTLYKHKLLGKTNKLFEKAGIHYDKKGLKH